jgi:hypothetical protein
MSYEGYTPPGQAAYVVPDSDPWSLAEPRAAGYRGPKPSGVTPVPGEDSPEDFGTGGVIPLEGGGHAWDVQEMQAPWDEPAWSEAGARPRRGGRPAWDPDSNWAGNGPAGGQLRSQDQGGAALRRSVAGADVDMLDAGWQSKPAGEEAVYWQEPPDSYFRMGRNAYPETNPDWRNERSVARATDEPRAPVTPRMKGARHKAYIRDAVTTDAMLPVSYRQGWGIMQRPWTGRQAVTVATTLGLPDWGYYSPQPSPSGLRVLPPDPDQGSAYSADDSEGDGEWY